MQTLTQTDQTMLSVLLFCWAVLALHTTATCFHLQRTSVSSGASAEDPERHQWLETYFIRMNGNKRAQKPVRRASEGNFNSWKDQDKSCFSVLNMKSHDFLCLDSKGKLYTSVFDINEDCRFRRVKRHKGYDVFHSWRGDVLLVRHQQVKTSARNLPKPSGFVFVKQHKNRTHHRKRRSWRFDPSDPLGSEYPHINTMRNWRSDPEHGGNVSKETITSVDDPLEVLLSHSALTPTLEKHRDNRKLRF